MATEARIADLVFRYLQGSLSPEEEQELHQWTKSSPQNKALFDKYSNAAFLEDLWRKDTVMMERVMPAEQAPISPAPFFRMAWLRYATAAAAVILMCLGTYLYKFGDKPLQPQRTVPSSVAKNDVAPGSNKATLTLGDGSKIVLEKNPDGKLAIQGNTKIVSRQGALIYYRDPGKNNEVVYNTLSTNRGEAFPLTFSDGTRIWLNAASSIRFPVSFSGNERSVQVTGEAYFEVAKDLARPFKVQLNGMEITVLGTRFNVNGYSDETNIKTTLVEGAVKIKKGAEDLVLAPGQQANLSTSGKITLVRSADIEKAVSWKDGYFHFDNNDLESVMRQLSRWYDVEIIYDNESLKHERHFSGDMEKSLTLSAVLRVLEKSQVHFRIDGKKLIVIS